MKTYRKKMKWDKLSFTESLTENNSSDYFRIFWRSKKKNNRKKKNKTFSRIFLNRQKKKDHQLFLTKGFTRKKKSPWRQKFKIFFLRHSIHKGLKKKTSLLFENNVAQKKKNLLFSRTNSLNFLTNVRAQKKKKSLPF